MSRSNDQPPKPKQRKLKLRDEEVIRFTDVAAWQPAPCERQVAANDLSAFIAKLKAAGLHLMRMAVIEKPRQGYKCMVVAGSYSDGKPEQKPQVAELPWG